MAQSTPLGGKIRGATEISGIVPAANIDPLLATKVGGIVALGSGGFLISPGVDGSYNIQQKRVKAGTNITITDDGTALTITGSGSVGGGDMNKSVYDIGNLGQVDHATLADTVAAGSIGTASIAANAVTAAKIANATITNTQCAAGLAVANLGFTPVNPTRAVNTSQSLTGGGALTADLALTLVGDTASPGNSKYYGTNGSGVRGWYASSAGAGDMTKAVYDTNNDGIVEHALLADTVSANAVGTAGIAANAVTAAKIAAGTITNTQLAAGVAAANLTFTPVNRAGDAGVTGDIAITVTGPTIDTSAYLNGHLSLQTSGNAGGYPVIGFGRVGTSDGTGGGLAVYFTGLHADLSLQYADGTTGTLLSSNSVISGAQISSINGSIITAGTIPNSKLTSSSMGARNVTIVSVTGPSGGADGDIWLAY